jgi:hypothetical protein
MIRDTIKAAQITAQSQLQTAFLSRLYGLKNSSTSLVRNRLSLILYYIKKVKSSYRVILSKKVITIPK